MYIAPGQGQKNLLGQTFDVNRKLRQFVVSFKQIALILILYTVFMVFHMYIAPGQGHSTLCGQNPDVNRKDLSFCQFGLSFKTYL